MLSDRSDDTLFITRYRLAFEIKIELDHANFDLVIYALALSITILNPPPGEPHLTWRERFATAYANLHANIHLSAITPLNVSWSEDFYTAILKIGLTVLTAASEAVYLNEAMRINVHSSTWLEQKRYSETVARRRQEGRCVSSTSVT